MAEQKLARSASSPIVRLRDHHFGVGSDGSLLLVGSARADFGLRMFNRDGIRLSDIGVSRVASSRWQQVAAVPEPTFEAHIAQVKEQRKELTTAGVLLSAARSS